MEFREMKKILVRFGLKTRGFYEGINFESKKAEKKLKKLLKEWMFYLNKYKKIRIGCFKDLFRKFNEIEFPITIKGCWGSFNLEATIIDNRGIAYYMLKDGIFCYNGLESYIIGRRDIMPGPLVIDTDFKYKILKDGSIALNRKGIMKSKTDTNIGVDFSFDSEKHTTEATLKSYASNSKIKMKYTTMDDEFDKKVQEYLFNVNEKNYYYYDVFPILKWMISTVPSQNVSLSITAEVDDEICSKIDVVQGIVQRYAKTEIINEGERRTSIDVFAKRIEDFLAERS